MGHFWAILTNILFKFCLGFIFMDCVFFWNNLWLDLAIFPIWQPWQTWWKLKKTRFSTKITFLYFSFHFFCFKWNKTCFSPDKNCAKQVHSNFAKCTKTLSWVEKHPNSVVIVLNNFFFYLLYADANSSTAICYLEYKKNQTWICLTSSSSGKKVFWSWSLFVDEKFDKVGN